MLKPYINWDPSTNLSLVHRAAGAGHTFGPGNLDELAKLVAVRTVPRVSLGGPGGLGEIQCFEQLAFDDDGVRVRQFDALPRNIEFLGVEPVNGEPNPLDPDDYLSTVIGPQPMRYILIGHRLALRGWIGGPGEGLPTEMEVSWKDSAQRDDGDTGRGRLTGLLLHAIDTPTPGAWYSFYGVHGKRRASLAWNYRGGRLADPFNGGATAESVVPWDAIEEGKVRIALSEDSGWSVVVQYWNGSAWVDLYTESGLTITGNPSGADYLGITGELFCGQTQAYPGGSLQEDTWFPEITLRKFEPWVLNVAELTVREWLEKMFGYIGAPTVDYTLTTPSPYPDLMHSPIGSPNEPAEIRATDEDLGICVGVTENSTFQAWGAWEFQGVLGGSGAESQPLVMSDTNIIGPTSIDIPFTCGIRLKMTDMVSDTPGDPGYERNFISFGNIHLGLPTASENGIGIGYEHSGSDDILFARIFVDGARVAWCQIDFPFQLGRYQDRPVELALRWTGNRGVDCGYPDHSLQLLINGQVVATSGDISADDPKVAGTRSCTVGAMGSDPGWNGYFGSVQCFMDALTDDDVRRMFKTHLQPETVAAGGTIDFDTADPDGEPGQADGWEWSSSVPSKPMALFRQSPWTGPEEPFDWFDGWPSITSGNEETFDLYPLTTHAVGAVLPGSNRIDLVGVDYTLQLPPGSSFRITGSTGLDAYWTVQTASFTAGDTRIITVEDVLSNTADGQVEFPKILYINVNGYAAQFAQFWDLYFEDANVATAAEVADVINAYVQHVVARAWGGFVHLRSETQGFFAMIEVLGGSANGQLAFSTTAVFGVDDVGWFDSWDDVTSVAADFGGDGEDGPTIYETFEWTDWFDTIEEAGVVRMAGRSWWGQYLTRDITEAGTDYFKVAGDMTGAYPSGTPILVTGSTANDETYTVDSSTFGGGETTINVLESVPDTTADGQVCPYNWTSDVESFDEGWGLDPFVPIGFEIPTRNGKLYGAEIEFPIYIPPNRNKLWIYTDADGLIHEMFITEGTYDTPTQLAGGLQARYGTIVTASAMNWDSEDTGDTTGRISFGWSGVAPLTPSEVVFLCVPDTTEAGNDMRSLIGFDQFSPSGTLTKVPMPGEMFDGGPPEPDTWTTDNLYLVDTWSYLWVETTDIDGDDWPLVSGRELALFNQLVASTNKLYEAFGVEEWGGAPWIGPAEHGGTPDTSLTTGFVAAMFDSDGTPEPYEDFEEGWP